MPKSDDKIKPVSELTYDDFQQYPVWTWYESEFDESLVVPVETMGPFAKEEYGALFILAELELRDGTKMMGEISVNLMNQQVYNLVFYEGDKEFLFTGKNIAPLGTLRQLSEWLKKPVEAITPVRYTTSFSFEDGTPIVGKIELQDW